MRASGSLDPQLAQAFRHLLDPRASGMDPCWIYPGWYDCEFVAAAQQLGVLLIMEDRAILAAVPEVAQSLEQASI